ncbi:SHOCT domain-containing protein [Nocardioides sp. MJB4]|uniref:SHOCT domain-containing protein n=2 Tax=Nocardioides donggukensis TaxID=2774019 RepID=A0A927PZD1_9ACTN|nr:SHOCT domain-containing protein [Nocardioides donggukensis]
MGYDHDGGWGPGAWILMGLFMLTFWSLLLLGAYLVLRGLGGGRGDRGGVAGTESEAERLLAQRFARGEIDADEFSRRRELLRSSG